MSTMKRLQTAAARLVLAALCVAVVVVEAGKKRGKKGEDPVSPYPEMSKVQADLVEWATNPMVSCDGSRGVSAAATRRDAMHATRATLRVFAARSLDRSIDRATATSVSPAPPPPPLTPSSLADLRLSRLLLRRAGHWMGEEE